ncbi:signal peptidase II [Konateibacter massiliensis]|uniref:signal peptidase II n=1 Tax=Konateibacter massiliensis TaxID=2002841 RepID=UPI001F262A98|nr:signal peptidase II [Konateibacter massiliensis]
MVYFLISAGIFALDFVVKKKVETNLEYNKPEKKWKDRLIIRKIYNRGGALNTMDSNQQFVAGFSAALTVSAVMAQLWLSGKKGLHVLKLALSMIIGGACSNVYDRIVRKYVVDYFSFNTKFKKLQDIVFNISDMFIFVGTAVGALYAMFADEEKDR